MIIEITAEIECSAKMKKNSIGIHPPAADFQDDILPTRRRAIQNLP
jgi:hypothetical protein